MKRIILALLLFVFCLGNLVFAEPVNLEYKFNQGQVDKYSYVIEMTMNMPAIGGKQIPPINFTMNSIMINKIVSVNNDGSAKIKCYMSPPKLDVSNLPGSAKKMPKMQAATMYYTMTKDGKVTNFEGLDKLLSKTTSMDMRGMLNQMTGNYSRFPGKPVEVGETWDSKVPIPVIGTEMTISSTYASDNETYNQIAAYKLKQTCDANIDLTKIAELALKNLKTKTVDASKAMQGFNGTMNMVGFIESLFSKETSTILSTDGKMTIKMIMNMPEAAIKQGAPATMEINMDMGFKMNKI